MKTRNQAKRPRQSYGQEDGMIREAGDDHIANGTLSNTSHKGANKIMKQANTRRSRGLKGKDINFDSASKLESLSKGKDKQVKVNIDSQNVLEVKGSNEHTQLEISAPMNTDDGSILQAKSELEDEMADSDWEDGSNPNMNSESGHSNLINKDISIEIDASPGTSKRKPIRRASAEEKEVAELVHRTHLLCLLGRGRLIDTACDDLLIQASLLSLLPAKFLKLSEATNLTVDALTPLVNWFHSNFQVRSSSSDRSFPSALATALATHEGTPEEVAALSVAMFRALNILTRFVSILDVASLKPDADKSDDTSPGKKAGKGVFESTTVMLTRSNEPSTSSSKQSPPIASIQKNKTPEPSTKASRQKKVKKSKDGQPISSVVDQSNDRTVDLHLRPCEEGSKRKGDIEFEMQMQMALSATATETSDSKINTDVKTSNTDSLNISPFKKLKQIKCEDSSLSISTAIGSRKVGGPMYWAEVYLNGKWVHIDAVNASIDGEQKVEALAAACKTSLRYVVAFSGHGAKDVTRRYCAKWYKIASHRVNSTWWDAVLLPLKDLESKTAGGTSRLCDSMEKERTSLEDMELETKALTEPLPTNQQAYRSHHLYALERWLTKYQILHPKGPILGFCSGHPVYPRACVQMLHTKERWLREGLQLKKNELPVKVLKRSIKGKITLLPNEQEEEDENDCVGPPGGTIDLYGKWQTEPLCLPPAQNGIVPKNERGQVDVWSEKCLPPGTVHLGFPRIFNIAKKIGIDYAPAMVGFEFKNGRSYPLYNGIVVCSEFKDTILDAYGEEEEMRGKEERRKNEAKAISRWYQLLSSIVTRQRLNNRYAQGINDVEEMNDHCATTSVNNSENIQKVVSHQEDDDVAPPSEEDHEHVFVSGSFDEESCVRTKSCRCGFSIEVEEM